MIHALRTSTTPLAAARNGPRLAGQAAPRPPFAAAPLLYRRRPPGLVGEAALWATTWNEAAAPDVVAAWADAVAAACGGVARVERVVA